MLTLIVVRCEHNRYLNSALGGGFTETPPTPALTPRLNCVHVTRETVLSRTLSLNSRDIPNATVFPRELRESLCSRDTRPQRPLPVLIQREGRRSVSASSFFKHKHISISRSEPLFPPENVDRSTWTLFTFSFTWVLSVKEAGSSRSLGSEAEGRKAACFVPDLRSRSSRARSNTSHRFLFFPLFIWCFFAVFGI